MKRIIILNILVLVVSLSSFKVVNAQDIVRYQKDLELGYDFLSINLKDSTYNYCRIFFYDVGGFSPLIMQGGTFERKGDTLILNSRKKPKNYDILKVEEFVVPNVDSVEINVKYDNEDFGPSRYYINKVRYDIGFMEKVKIKIGKQSIKSIIILDFLMKETYCPIYYPKNPSANLFNIIIYSQNIKEEDVFTVHGESVFFDEEFLIKGNELINIKDVKGFENYTPYKKVDSFEKIDIMRDYDWYIY